MVGPAKRIETPADRLFVPLASGPYEWFGSGAKEWELRKLGRQYTPKHLVVGRRVELRRGYSLGNSIWGTLADVRQAGSILEFFRDVPFSLVIPPAKSLEEAVETARGILGTADLPVIGFRVEVD